MNHYQLRYIELKQEYEQSDGASKSVQVLYVFKDFLEEQDTPDAKRVLVDVCETLKLYKTAYDTLLPLVTRSDKTSLKQLVKLLSLQEQGDHFALRRLKGGKKPYCMGVKYSGGIASANQTLSFPK